MPPPRLLPLPSTVDLPNVKITHSGVTILHQRGSKSCYGGSSAHVVDASGKLWESKKEMIEAIYPERLEMAKKKASTAIDTKENRFTNNKNTLFFNKLLTHEQDFLTNLPELSTKKTVRTYRVKKTEVRQRILAHISAKRHYQAELYFWTLTFPEGTPDGVIYQIFNIWLTILRSKDAYGRRFIKDYLWIAERQKNKTIHFHVAIPHKMHVGHANKVMAKTLENFARKGDIPYPTLACKRYNGVHLAKGKFNKATNFASKKGSNAISHYLTKYLTKNNEVFYRLAWHNSRGFSNLFTSLYTTKKKFYSMGVKRWAPLGGWHVVPWWVCLEENKSKWFPRRGGKGSDEEKQIAELVKAGTYFFQFIPWGNEGPPANVLNHIAGLNGYCMENFRNKKIK